MLVICRGKQGRARAAVPVLAAIAAAGLSLAAPAAASAAQQPAAARHRAETALAWGFIYNAALGARDPGVIVPTPVPVSLPAGTRVTAVAAGGNDSLAVMSAGGVLAWGQNSSGELGDGTTADSLTPVPVSMPARVRVSAVSAVAAGAYQSLVLTVHTRC